MQPIHKSKEILDELGSILQADQTINDMRLRKYVNDINKYFHGLEKNYALGVAYGLNKDISRAIYYFDLALQVPNGDYALGYISIICNLGTTRQARELCTRVALQYESKMFARFAFQYSLYYADLENMNVFMARWIKLSLDDERVKLEDELKKSGLALSRFRDVAGFSQSEHETLSGMVMDLIDENDYRVLGVQYFSTNSFDESLNSYIVSTSCSSSSALANMNMDLAFKLVAHDELLNKDFSVYIKGPDRDSSLEGSTCQ